MGNWKQQMSDMVQTELIQIGGAGPAGLAATITLARRVDYRCI